MEGGCVMVRMNKYEGHLSAYARNEGVWVPGYGVNPVTAAGIAALILRDYRRGWTYDSRGRRIPMDKALFRERLFYLIALSAKHYHNPELTREVKQLVEYVYRNLRLPPWAIPVLTGPNARRVADELIRMGIAKAVRVRPTPAPRVWKPVPVSVPVPRVRR